MKTITLRNDFHNTSVTLRVPDTNRLSPGQVKRAQRILCPVRGCDCGGALAERGPQDGGWVLYPYFDQDPNTGRSKLAAEVEWIESYETEQIMKKRPDEAMAALALIQMRANVIPSQTGYWADLKWIQRDSGFKLERLIALQSEEDVADALRKWGEDWLDTPDESL